MRILIIKISSLGDILNATYVIQAIKNQYKEAVIDIVIDPRYKEIVENLNIIENFYFYDEAKYSEYLNLKKYKLKIFINISIVLKEIISTIKKINKNNYDIVLDLQGIEKSLIFYFSTKSNKKACKWSLPYKNVQENKNMHAILALFHTTKKVLPEFKIEFLDYKLNRQKLNKININEDEIEKYDIVIGPFTRWETKNYPVSYIIILAVLFAKSNYNILILGSNQDKFSWEKEIDNFNNFESFKSINIKSFYEFQHNILNKNYDFSLYFNDFIEYTKNNKIKLAFGKFNFGEIGLILQESKLFIGCDSFLSHYAHALGTPQIYLFGPTEVFRFGPIKNNPSIVMRNEKLDCLGCHKRKCPKKGYDYIKCMNSIMIEDVYQSSIKILENL